MKEPSLAVFWITSQVAGFGIIVALYGFIEHDYVAAFAGVVALALSWCVQHLNGWQRRETVTSVKRGSVGDAE